MIQQKDVLLHDRVEKKCALLADCVCLVHAQAFRYILQPSPEVRSKAKSLHAQLVARQIKAVTSRSRDHGGDHASSERSGLITPDILQDTERAPVVALHLRSFLMDEREVGITFENRGRMASPAC